LERLDSGLAVIPDPDPGRNDKKGRFLTFYEFINIRYHHIYSGLLIIKGDPLPGKGMPDK